MDHGDSNTPLAVRVLVVGPDQSRVTRAVARLTSAGLVCDAASSPSPAALRGRLLQTAHVVVALEVGGSWQPTVRLFETDMAVSCSGGGYAAPVLVLSDGTGRREKIDALASGRSGVWDWVETSVSDDEIVARINRLARIGRMMEEIQDLTRRCSGMETVDRLTGLPNHRAFQEYLTIEFRRAERYAAPLSLLIVDFDRFRSLNETHGHQWGDRVLQHSARGVRTLLREIDMVARFGGEEFAVLLPETDTAAALTVAARVRAMIATVPAMLSGATGVTAGSTADTPRLTASIGVASCPHEATATRGQLLAAAESALRRAKDEGRNRSVVAGTQPAGESVLPGPASDAPGESAFRFGQMTR